MQAEFPHVEEFLKVDCVDTRDIITNKMDHKIQKSGTKLHMLN